MSTPLGVPQPFPQSREASSYGTLVKFFDPVRRVQPHSTLAGVVELKLTIHRVQQASVIGQWVKSKNDRWPRVGGMGLRIDLGSVTIETSQPLYISVVCSKASRLHLCFVDVSPGRGGDTVVA